MSWITKPIGAFCRTGSGGTPSRQQESRFYGGSIPWVKSGELKESIVFETEETITEAALAESSAKIIPPGALLVAMYGATVGRIAILGIEAASNQAVCHIVPDESAADQRYLFYALRTQVPRWLEQRVGGAQPNISQQIIRDTQIPLPPLEEQRRIAAILDKADAVRRKRKEAIALTEELLRSAFLEMFGDPVTNPKGWHTNRLGDLAKFVGGGTPSRQKSEYYQGDICWATPKDMAVDVLIDTEEHITLEAIEQSATKLVAVGSLLVVVKSKVLGRRLPIARTMVPTCFGQDLKAIIPYKADITRYLHRHIKYGELVLLQLARGVNTEGLTLEHLHNYQVMVPPTSDVNTSRLSSKQYWQWKR